MPAGFTRRLTTDRRLFNLSRNEKGGENRGRWIAEEMVKKVADEASATACARRRAAEVRERQPVSSVSPREIIDSQQGNDVVNTTLR